MTASNATTRNRGRSADSPPRTIDEIVQQDGAYSTMNIHELFYALGKRFKTRQGAYDALRLGQLPDELGNAVFLVGREYRVSTAKVLRYLGAELPSIEDLPKAV